MGFTINVKNPELIDNLIHCLFNFKISIKNQYYLVIQMILWSKLNNCKTFLIKSWFHTLKTKSCLPGKIARSNRIYFLQVIKCIIGFDESVFFFKKDININYLYFF